MPENKGLYTKYHVRDTNEKALDSGTIVLRPFNADGSIRDHSVVSSLPTLAHNYERDGYGNLAMAIRTWLEQPDTRLETQELNVPPEPSSQFIVVETFDNGEPIVSGPFNSAEDAEIHARECWDSEDKEVSHHSQAKYVKPLRPSS